LGYLQVGNPLQQRLPATMGSNRSMVNSASTGFLMTTSKFVRAFRMRVSDFIDARNSNPISVPFAVGRCLRIAFVLWIVANQTDGQQQHSGGPEKDPSKERQGPVFAAAETGAKKDLFQRFENWQVVDKYMFRDHGQVVQEEGEFRLSRGDPGTGIRFRRSVLRDNYQVTFAAKRLEGKDFFCGLTFPVGSEHCTLILGGWGGSVVGLSNVDGEPAVENETAKIFSFKSDQWYRIRLRVEPERIRVWIDERDVIQLGRKGRRFSVWWEQEPLQPLGISTWETAGVIRKFDQRSIE